MTPVTTDVFFYGLFMDAAVLEAKGVPSTQRRLAVVRGWALRIGQRATLVPSPNASVHGVLMTLQLADVDRLYADASVQAYRPVAVFAETASPATPGDATAVPALAYVLPDPPRLRSAIRSTRPRCARWPSVSVFRPNTPARSAEPPPVDPAIRRPERLRRPVATLLTLVLSQRI